MKLISSFRDLFRLLFSRRWWWSTLLVVVAIGITIRLGIWQIDRNNLRQAEIRQLLAVQAMPELDLSLRPLPDDLAAMEYRPVTATGQYDFEHQVVLRNQARSRMTGTDPGYSLLTPLIMDDGSGVLVNRGWIPLEYDTPTSWRQFDEPGTVTVHGILRTSLQKGELGSTLIDPTLAPGETRLDYWNFVNLPRIQQQLPYSLVDVYIQEAPGVNQETIPYHQLDEPDLEPGDHMGFALSWFVLTAVLVIGYPTWLKKQK